MMGLCGIAAALMIALPAAAHQPGPPSGAPAAALLFDPWIAVPLAVAGGLYSVGLWHQWRRAGRSIASWQAWCFGLGWLSLAAAAAPPLQRMGERLFVAHMAEHEVLMVVAAPLLAASRPLVVMLWALPLPWRRALGSAARSTWVAAPWRMLSAPLTATVLHGVALWAWHAPRLFEAALASGTVHTLQHVSFLGTALLFWWALIRGHTRARGYGAAVLYLFLTSVHCAVLGALLTLAPQVVYPTQGRAAAAWGLTALEDQQLAGLLMWVPAGLVYAGAALAMAALWIRRSGRRSRSAYPDALVASE